MLFTGGFGPFDGRDRPRKHALAGAVAIGQDHIQVFRGEKGIQLVQRGLDRRHGAAGRPIGSSGGRHQLPPQHGKVVERPLIDPSRAVQGRQLPITVSAGKFRPDAETAQNFFHGDADGPDGRLGHGRVAQGVFERFFLVTVRKRVDAFGQGRRLIKVRVRGFQRSQCFRKPGHPVAPHLEVLAALAREEKGHRSGLGPLAVKAGSAEPERLVAVLFKPLGGLIQYGGPIPFRPAVAFLTMQNHDEPAGGFGVKGLTKPEGHVRQIRRGIVLIEVLTQLREGFHKFGMRARTQGDHFDRAIPGNRVALWLIFFEHHVEIAATESEGADAGPAGLVPAAEPGPCDRVEIKGTVLQADVRIGLFDL